MHHYRAFGLQITSAFPLFGPVPTPPAEAEVTIIAGDAERIHGLRRRTEEIAFSVPELADFRISRGSVVTVAPVPNASAPLMSLYLLGSCMGAILWQRGGMLLHGSCVAKNDRGLLILGDTGAGKSTLAREFLHRGYRLVTDDVASIVFRDGHPHVQSSYPSQKLWQDAMDRYHLSGEPLMQEERREKFGVDASGCFREGLTPLCAAVYLTRGDSIALQGISGVAGADLLMRSTYRPHMLQPSLRERHFQRCVDIADEADVLLAHRGDRPDAACALCTMLEQACKEAFDDE